MMYLRRADRSDKDLLFEWRNDPSIALLGRNQRIVEVEEHARWFAEVVESDRHLLLIVVCAEGPCGQVRFDPADDGVVEVSIYLLPEHRGRKIGTTVLREACGEARRKLRCSVVRASVRRDNPNARRFFEKAGFLSRGEEAGLDLMELQLEGRADV